MACPTRSVRLAVLERYYRELLNFCNRTIRNSDAAADAVQETYARVLSAQQGEAELREPRALLYRTARKARSARAASNWKPAPRSPPASP